VVGGWSRMASEAPPGYVAFVQAHLEPLRRDAARVVGDEIDPDVLYQDVLADVAARWNWLELLGSHLGRPGAASAYLEQAFARRCARWRAEQMSGPADGYAEPSDVRVLRPNERLALLPLRSAVPAPEHRSTAGARQARFLTPARTASGALAEAAIAWWHAYEAHRRRILITALVLLFVFCAVVLRLQQIADASASS
jgi:hypothetical protein